MQLHSKQVLYCSDVIQGNTARKCCVTSSTQCCTASIVCHWFVWQHVVPDYALCELYHLESVCQYHYRHKSMSHQLIDTAQ